MMAANRPAILSASLGRAWCYDFDRKVRECAKAGFEGIEIFYEDLETLATKLSGTATPNTAQLVGAADHILIVCQQAGLQIIGLQPFLFYEGLVDREQHERLIEKVKVWFQLAKHLGTDTIQIPANFLPAEELTNDLTIIANDLQQLADLGLNETPVIRFAYEALCWSTHIDTWEKSWDVVQRVNRPNFGLCLDTFNIAGRVWGDPAAQNGKTSNADADMKASIARMIKDLSLGKIFYIQVVDAEKMSSPLVKGHEFHTEGQPPRMNWSRNARAFIYETDRGAYLPVEDIARALVHDLGYKGWISMELFSRTMAEPGQNVPTEHARRGMTAWTELKHRLHL